MTASSPRVRRARGVWLFSAVFAFAVSGCHCGQHLRSLSGEGTVSPAQLDFGSVTLGQTVAKKIAIQNLGTASLMVTQATFSGTNPADFSLAQSIDGKSIEPAATLTALVQFTPLQAGARAGTLTIATDGKPALLTVALTGTGVDIHICPQPGSLDFGPAQVAGTPIQQQLVFNNCGKSPSDLSLGALEGPQAGDFAILGSTVATLQPGQSLTVSVAYSPVKVGMSTADFPFKACAQCSPAPPITLGGLGVDGALTFSPNPVAFGNVNPGQNPTVAVTATNSGSEPITLTALAPRAASSPFSLVSPPALPAQLMPGQALPLAVQFTANGSGMVSDFLDGVFSVADPAVAARTSSVPLTATGAQAPCTLQITPTPVAFGNVAPNTLATRSVSLANTGQAACSVTGIALSAATDPYFTLANPGTTSLTIAPGAASPIAIDFKPTSANNPLLRSGALVFQSNDPTHTSVSVPLTGYVSNSVYSGGWPKWHYDNFNSGQSPADTSGLQGVVAWKFAVGPPTGATATTTYINSPVADSSGNIYQVSMAGTLHAISPTGTSLWTATLNDCSGDPHPATPAILGNGSLLVATGSDSINIGNNLFYVNSSGTIVSSQAYGEDGFDACPALSNDGTLFLGDDDAPGGTDPYSAVAFKANGSTLTQVAGLALPLTLQSERFGIVIAADDTSYWGNDGQFFAITPPSAGFQLAPTWPAGGVTQVVAFADPNAITDVISDLALDAQVNNHLYIYSAWEDLDLNGRYGVQGVLSALNPVNGATVWTLHLPLTNFPTGWLELASDSGNAAPAIALDGTVYVGNGDGLRAVNGANGQVKWLFSSGNVSSSPAIGADGTIFYGTSDNHFYAVKPNGTLRFKIATGGPISSSPAIASDGSVYFTCDDGNVYAVH